MSNSSDDPNNRSRSPRDAISAADDKRGADAFGSPSTSRRSRPDANSPPGLGESGSRSGGPRFSAVDPDQEEDTDPSGASGRKSSSSTKPIENLDKRQWDLLLEYLHSHRKGNSWGQRALNRLIGQDKGADIAIVGPGASGKSYIFRALVKQALLGFPGPVSHFLPDATPTLHKVDPAQLLLALRNNVAVQENTDPKMAAILTKYERWERLSETIGDNWGIYRLGLHHTSGIGQDRLFNVHHLEFPGEWLDHWHSDEYIRFIANAGVVVVVIPAKALWPTTAFRSNDRKKTGKDQVLIYQQKWLKDFPARLLKAIEKSESRCHPRYIIALSQFDSEDHTLAGPREQWVKPFYENRRLLEDWQGLSGVVHFVEMVQDWSRQLSDAIGDSQVPGLVKRFSYGANGQPLIIPMSAIDGASLDKANPDKDKYLPKEVPDKMAHGVHCELPVLFSLLWQKGVM